MKLLLDDKQHRGCNLNANEACIFAAILKCTRAGRGWYGNYRELAAAMPFVINRTTVYRAIQKLLNLGLIEERENKTLFAVQIAQESVQNEHESVQNAQECVQNVLPPNNPPINNNNMNEKEKEQPRALCTHDGDEQQDSLFGKFFDKFTSEFKNRHAATEMLWEHRSAPAQQAMWDWVRDKQNGSVNKNPYFFVQDFPEPQPVFLRGDESGDIVQVKYNGAYKLCTRATMELFGLEFVRNW